MLRYVFTNEYESAITVIRTLNSAGYDAFLVGGCVRNFLLGLPPNDFDIAASASVEQIESLFGSRVIGSGETHGTVLVLPDGTDQKIEVTAYRDGAKTLREDIRERVIREDPLRILRAMRVVAVLGSE